MDTEERRVNMDIVINKLDNLSDKFDTFENRFLEHLHSNKEELEKINHHIHGNGSMGMKSNLEVVKSRVALISFVLAGAWTAIVGAYIKIKGG